MIGRKAVRQRAICCAFLSAISYGVWTLTFGDRSRIVQDIQALLKDPVFTGEKECGHFSCFGTTLCKDIHAGFLKISEATRHRRYRSWHLYNGKLLDPRLPQRFRNCTVRILESECSQDDSECRDKLFDSNLSLKQFRRKVCRKLARGKNCDLIPSIQRWDTLIEVQKTKDMLPAKYVRGLSTPLRCASQRFVNRIVRRSTTKYGYMAITGLSKSDKATLVFKLKIAPGSWMQEAFPGYEGWPFGETYGSCGRILVHKRLHKNLREMRGAPWKIRVDLASQLLDIAFKLTENDDRYLFLMHRLAEDDFAVTETGKLKILNPDDVIVVDKREVERVRKEHWDETYQVSHDSKREKTEEKYPCRYKDTDINFYTVCRLLLDRGRENGLLHDPEEKEEFSSKLDYLVDVCIRGQKSTFPRGWAVKAIRQTAAKKLREYLGYIQPCSPEVPYRFPECESVATAKDLYRVPWLEVH